MSDAFPPLTIPTAEAVPAPACGRRWIAAGAAAVVLAAAGVAWTGVSGYNQLQFNDARVGFCWNQVINMYTRRADLVPNLMAVVRSYTRHESELLTQIAATRARIQDLASAARDGGDPQQVARFQAAQSQLSAQLGRQLQVAERYPDLRSFTLYQDLMVLNPLVRQVLPQVCPTRVFLGLRKKMDGVIEHGDAGYQPPLTFTTPKKKNAAES